MTRSALIPRTMLAFLPALIVFAIYEVFLGHRHDYSGHYAAGYGGTLGALMLGLRLLPPGRFPQQAARTILWGCVGCILLGALAEATVFRLARFDELDFLNQSLGAVLAAIVALAFAGRTKPAGLEFDLGLITGVGFLGLGGVFSVA